MSILFSPLSTTLFKISGTYLHFSRRSCPEKLSRWLEQDPITLVRSSDEFVDFKVGFHFSVESSSSTMASHLVVMAVLSGLLERFRRKGFIEDSSVVLRNETSAPYATSNRMDSRIPTGSEFSPHFDGLDLSLSSTYAASVPPWPLFPVSGSVQFLSSQENSAHVWSGVSPTLSLRFGFAPAASRILTVSCLPDREA